MVTKIVCFAIILNQGFCDYWSERKELIASEESKLLGNDIVLTEKEAIVNKFLMGHKLREYDNGLKNPSEFLPSKHFFEVFDDIEESMVFQFIKQLPKGGVLHVHRCAMLSFDALYNLTYEEHLHTCTVNGKLRLKFMLEEVQDEQCQWRLLKTVRQKNSSYDDWLKSQLTLITENPKETYKDADGIEHAINDIILTIDQLLKYRPVWEHYLFQSLLELYEDQVSYLEFRVGLHTLYDLDGRIYHSNEVFAINKMVIERFKKRHRGFLDARCVLKLNRNCVSEDFTGNVDIIKAIKKKFPGFLVGFDVVGQEDRRKSLKEFVSVFQNLSLDFVVRGGNTNWFGTNADQNLVDAIVLEAKRIGDGYALTKHPVLMNLAKLRDVAVVVCPISNQVSMLVNDMRNHPAVQLIASGYSVAVSSDSPTFWGSKGLSYDFYMVFMGMAPRNADLRLLKKLAYNSIFYSSLPKPDKQVIMEQWQQQWKSFINVMVDRLKKFVH